MAFGRLERVRPPSPMSDINMTPLIDVMLVLLVIFMVTAPLMASSVKLDLPRSEAATPVSSQRALTVTLKADGQVLIDGETLPRDAWSMRLVAAARQDPNIELHLRADQAVPYGLVAELIGAAQKAGLTRIGFATEASPPSGGTPPAAAPAAAPAGLPATTPPASTGRPPS
jgi:biopolymer transport protein TolR